MTSDQAIAFLAANQPFAPTDQLSESTLEQMEAARQALVDSPDPRCIPLWLGAFGEGDAHGIYPMVSECLALHGPELVIPELVQSLGSRVRSVQYWSTQIAMEFGADELIDPLLALIANGDEELQQCALVALDSIGSEAAAEAVEGVTSSNAQLKSYLDMLQG